MSDRCEDGEFHLWTPDGPMTVTCDTCGKGGKIVADDD